MKKFLLLMILFAMPFSAVADSGSHKYAKVEVYYYDWEIPVRSDLSIDDVRKNYFIKTIIQDEYTISQFVNTLRIDELSPVHSNFKNVDVRLVIDLIKTDGSMETYIASRFYLYSSDLQREMKIDDEFRDRFRLNKKSSYLCANN